MMTGDTGGTGVYRSKQVNAHNHFWGDSLKPAHVDYVPALCTHRLSLPINGSDGAKKLPKLEHLELYEVWGVGVTLTPFY